MKHTTIQPFLLTKFFIAMKKYFYVAIMALTLGMFASCTGVRTAYKEPVIDEEAGTVNGVKYDKETYLCWEFTWEYTETCTGEGTESDHGVDYYWMTEFDAQSMKAEWDYVHNLDARYMGVGCTWKGSSSLTRTNHDVSDCSDY